jgi:hypothetical protein
MVLIIAADDLKTSAHHLSPSTRRLFIMPVTIQPSKEIQQRREAEIQALTDYLSTLDDKPPLPRILAHMTGQAVQLASQIFYALQEELVDREDHLAAFHESQRSLQMLLQLHRQAERNQQLAVKLDGEDRPRRRMRDEETLS